MIIRLLLGLVLVVVSVLFGIAIGASFIFASFFVPACVTLESTCSAARADELMNFFLHNFPEEQADTARKMGEIFYMIYRFGYVFQKIPTLTECYIATLKNPDMMRSILRTVEKRSKVNIEEGGTQ